MSKLTPEERQAAARDLLRVLDGCEAELIAVCIKHGLAASSLRDELADVVAMQQALRAELDDPFPYAGRR